MRHPRFQWVLALYYPQDTTEDMGPTGLLPGKQFYKKVSHADPQLASEPAAPLCGEAGHRFTRTLRCVAPGNAES